LALSQAGEAKARWVSPKSTLDAAFWESESDEEVDQEEEVSGNAAERIKSLACSVSASPDWDSDEGWIDVLGGQSDDACDSPAPKEEPAGVASRAPSKAIGSAAVPAEAVAVVGSLSSDEQLDAEGEPFGRAILADDPSADRQSKVCSNSERDVLLSFQIPCNNPFIAIEKFRFPQILLSRSERFSFVPALIFWTRCDKCGLAEFPCVFGENSTCGLPFRFLFFVGRLPFKFNHKISHHSIIYYTKHAVKKRSGTLLGCDTTAKQRKPAE
jgi:hypothetical protein